MVDGKVTAFASAEALGDTQLRDAPLRSLPRPSRLAEPLTIAPARAARAAAALGLETVEDLLEHLPFRHEDRREAADVASLVPGADATVVVEVKRIAARPTRRRRFSLVEATVADASGPMKVVWFNQPWVVKRLPPGTWVVLHGRYEGRNSFRVSEYEVTAPGGAGPAELSSTGLVPVYPATEGLPAIRLRELAWEHRGAQHDVVDPLPASILRSERLADRPAALAAVHYPEDDDDAEVGRRRLAFEELMLTQLTLLRRRGAREEGLQAPALPPTSPGEAVARPALVERWLADELPFEPTGDQRAAIETISNELAGERPMQRLLMGEVGSGKTVVALAAMLRAAEHGMQAALMAPTETLAEQHFATIQSLLGSEVVQAALLTGSTPAARRNEILGRLASGELAIVVGTHALIEEAVVFDRLAVAVIDEQHRFGVRQRAALDRKGAPDGAGGRLAPHALHLTATPIPRTLALTVYGDLDVTLLRELPAGRRPITTHVVAGERERARAYERIREELRAGRQAFVVCPLVEESEALQAKAATAEFERLRDGEFRDFRVVLLHGQMRPRAKQEAMAEFASGGADVLVATSVIEVGIDVPNATVMLVEDAERYGISQLHQLRGRVGRGEHASLCLLFGPKESQRLRALAEHDDGFRLAEIDLQIRGEGEVVGTRQHGLARFRVARLPDDAELLEAARAHAEEILAVDPELADPRHVLLGDALLESDPAALEPIPA
jgi:ATP-dependent DNA helicase RecG